MRRKFALGVLLSLLALPALAGDEGGKSPALGTQVEMPFLIAPMTLNGKLDKYAYISLKLVATSQAAAIEIREKLAFIQDAFVRDVNGESIAKPSDPASVDSIALAARLVADAKRIVGASKVSAIVFTQIKFSALHPGAGIPDVPPSEQAPPPKQAEKSKTP